MGPVDAELLPFGEVRRHEGLGLLAVEILAESRHVELEPLGVGQQVIALQSLLIGEEEIMEFPELALFGGRLRRLCGERSFGVEA